MKFDGNRLMVDQFDELKYNSYATKDLKKKHRTYMFGMAEMIDRVRDYDFEPDTGSETLDEIVGEYAENILDELVRYMIGCFVDELIGIMDNDEDYHEE